MRTGSADGHSPEQGTPADAPFHPWRNSGTRTAIIAMSLAGMAAALSVLLPAFFNVKGVDPATGEPVAYIRWLLSWRGLGVLMLLGLPVLVSALGYVGARTASYGLVGLGKAVLWTAFGLLVAFLLVTGLNAVALMYVPATIVQGLAALKARGEA